MDEMRRVAQSNRDYLAIGIITILVVVGIIFSVQLSRLRETQATISTPLSPAACGEHPIGTNSGDPLGNSPQREPYLPQVNTPGREEEDDDSLSQHEEPMGKLPNGCWVLQSELPKNLNLDKGDWFVESSAFARRELLLDNELLPFGMVPRVSYLHPQVQPSLPGGDLIIRFLPRLALVIDDWGYDWETAKDFLSLGLPFTAAVLPGRAKTQEQLVLLRQRGHEVILHLPMEPKNPDIELDKDCIQTHLSEAEIRSRVEAALEAVGRVAGVNNHMGSKATSDERVVRAVLEVIKERGLYFIDSRTASTSVAGELAAQMGIPTATNQAFLDHYDDVERVKRQLERLIRRAKQDGQALGIGHVRPQTYRALVEMIPRFHEEGVIIVPASHVVSTP